MIEARSTSWHDANRRYLELALLATKHKLLAHLSDTLEPAYVDKADSADSATDEMRDIVSALDIPPAIEQLTDGFGLSEFEKSVVLLCAGIELDGEIAEYIAALSTRTDRPVLSIGLVLALFDDADWASLGPSAPLRYWRLTRVTRGSSLVAAELNIDERILQFLIGVDTPDDGFQGILQPLHASEDLSVSGRACVDMIARLWAEANPRESLPNIGLTGRDGDMLRSIAAAACSALGLQTFVIHALDIPVQSAERDSLVRLCEREALLTESIFYVDLRNWRRADSEGPEAFLQQIRCPVIVGSCEHLNQASVDLCRFNVAAPTLAEQSDLWRDRLTTEELGAANPDLIASQFRLSSRQIDSALAQFRADRTDAADTSPLWRACRDQVRGGLDNLAQRIFPSACWEDLVLPESQIDSLRRIASQVKHATTVYDRWGFGSRHSRGLGLAALFAGRSGTGKTMAAEVIAEHLDLDLYRIDLSQIVSKYIGETEKNLSSVFDAAEKAGSILLFDEADALFGKRSEVRDSHDRYANIEISYLLQRMEEYRGLAILTSNMKEVLDIAFLRRLRFIIEFPFPDKNDREVIWRGVFPKEAPLNGLDFSRLSQLNIPGGSIRNIALNAAFFAAERETPIAMTDVLMAARCEYEKADKKITDSELRGWL